MGIDTYVCIHEFVRHPGSHDMWNGEWVILNKDQKDMWAFKGDNIDALVDFDRIQPIDWNLPYPDRFRKSLEWCQYNSGIIDLNKYKITFCDV